MAMLTCLQVGVIERDLELLRLSDSKDYLRHIVLSAASQSAIDSSLTDSLELYHLAGAHDKVIETVNRALGHSLSSNTQMSEKISSTLGVGSAFGGLGEDLYALGEKVWGLYEGVGRVERGGWETLGVLLRLKKGLREFDNGRPDLALEVCPIKLYILNWLLLTFPSRNQTLGQTGLLPLDANPTSIPTCTTKFRTLLDQPAISSLDEVVVTAMKCLHMLSQELKNSAYGDQGRMELVAKYRDSARCLVQFASGLRLRLGGDVYRQLSSMSEFSPVRVWAEGRYVLIIWHRCFLLISDHIKLSL
jgi:nuclear pore complex protein Nup93